MKKNIKTALEVASVPFAVGGLAALFVLWVVPSYAAFTAYTLVTGDY